jgi:hypothetical protein
MRNFRKLKKFNKKKQSKNLRNKNIKVNQMLFPKFILKDKMTNFNFQATKIMNQIIKNNLDLKKLTI